MPFGAMIFLGVVLVVFPALDIIMLVSLSKPGDERSQIIVWKASSFTLLAIMGGLVLEVIEKLCPGPAHGHQPLCPAGGGRHPLFRGPHVLQAQARRLIWRIGSESGGRSWG